MSAKYAPMPILTSSPWHGDTWGSTWKVADDGQLLAQDQSSKWTPTPSRPPTRLKYYSLTFLAGSQRPGGLDVAVYVDDYSFRLYAVSSFDSFTSWVGEGYKLAVSLAQLISNICLKTELCLGLKKLVFTEK